MNYSPLSYLSNQLWHFKKKADYFHGNQVKVNGDSLEIYRYLGDGDYYRRKIPKQQPALQTKTPSPSTENFIFNEQKAICFCDIPIQFLPNHMKKYGDFGFGINIRSVIKNRKYKSLKPIKYRRIFSFSEEELTDFSPDIKIKEGEFFIDPFTKVNTYHPILNVLKDDNENMQESFDQIYEEREWRSIENLSIKLEDIDFFVAPDREKFNQIESTNSELFEFLQSHVSVLFCDKLFR